MSNDDHYSSNPLIHEDRRLGLSSSAWVRSFRVEDMKPLIICRGPIRKEAMDVFDEMGIAGYGILLSEKDSITYGNALAPELRKLTDPSRVHRVPDYTGATKEERRRRIEQIIRIAKDDGYDSIFAGYGFMAEDEEMVGSMERAGLRFIGPCSKTVHRAGLKDEAKRTALAVNVSTTPGIDNGTALTLLARYPDVAALKALVAREGLEVAIDLDDGGISLEDKADAVLAASYARGIDLYSIEELAEQLRLGAIRLLEQSPRSRFRLKAIGGGGGKGQRIMEAPTAHEGSERERIEKAAAVVPGLVREILSEVKATGVGDNKNILIELNIETTRHLEIQVVGNGEWCITMGGRDCSLQMHEQKLLEISVIHEELERAVAEARAAGRAKEARILEREIDTLRKMEEEAARFGKAVGLDSVSTFECIVDRDRHYFMEMNTRIQVEHRVTELCYGLRFTNPADAGDSFVVQSLVELMVLLARHGECLPQPTRFVRNGASVEVRMNATNQALQPHAGGVVTKWSSALEGEIRDDQGISMHNPDTDAFMRYRLAGAYDSNIALLLTVGGDRLETYRRMAEVLRHSVLRGDDLQTNLDFHYGLVHWFIGHGIQARPTTRFVVPYVTAVGLLREQARQVDVGHAFGRIRHGHVAAAGDDEGLSRATANALDRKRSLLTRPIERLFERPHVMAGWLSRHRKHFDVRDGKVTWLENPMKVLADTYDFLNMQFRETAAPASIIWRHDDDVLQAALAFYGALEDRLKTTSHQEIVAVLSGREAPAGLTDAEFVAARSAHAGYRLGTELLDLLPYIADRTGFFELEVSADLSIEIPARLAEKTLQDEMAKVLVPPPAARSDELLAPSGGMFYPREAPGMEPFVGAGDHFEKGDPLYIIEVMKMFNKVYAPFSGTIDEVLVETDGVIIGKGQTIFRVTPDERIEIETQEELARRRRVYTDRFLATLKG
ncbi:ATP-binding protein [Paraliomyxa miuraensis]|uniref:ATP-binding protein n=1 Tax=Paraliomyxa miuraensis TaxID=376150 RepID=UPI00224F909E|nr:biotin/lipoyl-containing protein [Paraliomyxa miuraensis]MCX4241909.1 biotin carboxylase [Paraliomyxa miuraensis]